MRVAAVAECVPGDWLAGCDAIICTFNSDLVFTSNEGSGLLSLGRQPGDLVGRTLVEISGSEESPAVVGVRAALRGDPRRYEWTCKGHVYEDRAVPLRDRAGRITGVISIAFEITEYRRSEAALRESREEMRRLSAAMNQIQENERRRIAREIHDELGQRLTALRFDLGFFRSEVRGGRAAEGEQRMAMMVELIDQTIGVVRRVARHSAARRVDVRIEEREGRIETEVRDNGRGITEEEANSVSSLGLAGVRERAYALGGEVVITGRPGAGTRVFSAIPNENSGRR